MLEDHQELKMTQCIFSSLTRRVVTPQQEKVEPFFKSAQPKVKMVVQLRFNDGEVRETEIDFMGMILEIKEGFLERTSQYYRYNVIIERSAL